MSLELIYRSPKILEQNQEGEEEKGEGKEESGRNCKHGEGSSRCPPQGSDPRGES